MEAVAKLKFIRISPRKVKVVLDLIRGKHVREAAAILKHLPKAACESLAKLLKAAVANASNNFNMQDDGMRSTSFYDVNSKSEMLDKSYAMLKERYQNGLITLDEFNKKCNKLNKMRKN